jgi:sugar/nucleoside kinase (ribokinase family)
MKQKICIIGNIVADFIAAELKNLPDWGELVGVEKPITMNIGGNGAISAVSSSRLALEPVLVGNIGNDRIGDHLIEELKRAKVEIKHVEIDKNSPTSVTLALARADGERIFFHHIGANAQLSVDNMNKVPLENMDALLLSSIFILPGINFDAVESYLKKVRGLDIPTCLDVAWDPTGTWDLKGILNQIDFFLPNEDELLHISKTDTFDMAAEYINKNMIGTLIVKQGQKGCTVFADNSSKKIKAPKVNAVDTTGAGDVFNAGFIFEFLKTRDVISSAKFAVHAASLSVTRIGGTSSAPDEKEVRNSMKLKG